MSFWEKYSKYLPELYEENGNLVITKFDDNIEIKQFLLLTKMLIPQNVASRDMEPITNKIFKVVSVNHFFSLILFQSIIFLSIITERRSN